MAPPGVDSMVRQKHFSGRRDRRLSAMNPNEKSKRRRKSEKKEMSRVSRFETGDFVWAKAFPYTWWPGRVYLRGVSTVSVAFFGCDKTRRFCVTDVRDFEEDYPQMIRTVEARLEDEIDRVLGEFGKSVERKGLSGFRAEEVLGFVKEMAVSTWVGDSGAARVARLAGQVGVYRARTNFGSDLEGTQVEKSSNPLSEDEISNLNEDVKDLHNKQKDSQVICLLNTMDEFVPDLQYAQDDYVSDLNNSRSNFGFTVVHAVQNLADNGESEQLHTEVNSNSSLSNPGVVWQAADSGVEACEDDENEAVDLCRDDDSLIHAYSDAEVTHLKHEDDKIFAAEEHSTNQSMKIYSLKIVKHIRSLALDPFFFRKRKLKSISKKMLKIRHFMFQNILDTTSANDALESDSLSEDEIFAAEEHPTNQSMNRFPHNIVKHIQSLAVDPFFYRKRKLKSISKKMLKLRHFMSLNIHDITSPDDTLGGDFLSENSENLEACDFERHDSIETGSKGNNDDEDDNTCENLHKVLWHLHSLASNQFSLKAESLRFVIPEILNYREMLYQHKNDIASPDDTSEHIREPEMSSLSEVDELRHPSKNGNVKMCSVYMNDSSAERNTSCGVVHKMLMRIHCLALDPFYLGRKKLRSICQEVLDFRKSVYLNVPDLPHSNSTPKYGFMNEVNKSALIEEFQQFSHISKDAKNSHFDEKGSADKIQGMREVSGIKESVCLSTEVTRTFPGEKVNIASDLIRKSLLPFNGGDERPFLQQKSMVRPVGHMENGSSSAPKLCRNLTLPINGFMEGRQRKRKPDQSIASDPSKLSRTQASYVVRIQNTSSLKMVNLSSSSAESHPDEMKRVANNITNKHIHSASDNHVKFLSSSKPVVDVKVVRGPSRRSIESLHTNQRSTKPFISDFSQKHPRQPFYPTTRLYASPLEIDRSVLPGNEIRQLGRNRSLGCSQSLHMKFPKDFTLPSKEDLVKKFVAFGPLEYRRTKVFLYMGSAQVVFLDPHDAAAAYQFVKKKSVFGKAMVRFWLDEHESSRRTSITEGSYQSTLDLKSCLKRPDVHREKDQKKLSRVQFSSDNQTTTSDYACDSSEVTRPDISPQMMQLLDNCDQLVCNIKQSLGLESIYSVFTHDFSCIAVMVDEPKCLNR